MGTVPKANPTAPHQPGGSFLVLPAQVVDADEEAILVVTNHVPDFAVVNPLIFLQEETPKNQLNFARPV